MSLNGMIFPIFLVYAMKSLIFISRACLHPACGARFAHSSRLQYYFKTLRSLCALAKPRLRRDKRARVFLSAVLSPFTSAFYLLPSTIYLPASPSCRGEALSLSKGRSRVHIPNYLNSFSRLSHYALSSSRFALRVSDDVSHESVLIVPWSRGYRSGLWICLHVPA